MTRDTSAKALNEVDRLKSNETDGRARQSRGMPSCVHKRSSRIDGPHLFSVFAGVFLGFSVLLCITGALTGGTGSPFSLAVFVLGFVIVVLSVTGLGLAMYDVDVLSEWTRASFTVTSALALFVLTGALGGLTAYLTFSP